MLNIFRKHRQKFFGFVMLGLVSLLMLGFGIDAFFSGGRNNSAMEINGRKVTLNEFSRERAQITSRMRRQLGESFDQFKDQLNIPQQTVDSIISQSLVDSFTDKLGFSVGDKQVAARIQQEASTYFNGNLTKDNYKRFLQLTGMTGACLLYTSPSPRDLSTSRMPSSA